MIAWSCGGGLQSVCIGVLIREHVLPVPDLAAIVDTSRERKTTWAYLHDVLQPYLAPVGVKIEVVPHTFARVDLYDKDGLTLVPAYTEEGRLAAFCSGEWKRDAMERWLRSVGVTEATQWLGFSWDEKHRCGKAHRPWLQPAYPLCERRITRAMCELIVERAGLPLPKKSRCWCCPHQNQEEWREVRADPEEWEKAVALDAAVREADERHALYLHSSRVPLALADLGQPGDEVPPLFRHCQEAGCYT